LNVRPDGGFRDVRPVYARPSRSGTDLNWASFEIMKSRALQPVVNETDERLRRGKRLCYGGAQSTHVRLVGIAAKRSAAMA
jgi:hypothetical protein